MRLILFLLLARMWFTSEILNCIQLLVLDPLTLILVLMLILLIIQLLIPMIAEPSCPSTSRNCSTKQLEKRRPACSRSSWTCLEEIGRRYAPRPQWGQCNVWWRGDWLSIWLWLDSAQLHSHVVQVTHTAACGSGSLLKRWAVKFLLLLYLILFLSCFICQYYIHHQHRSRNRWLITWCQWCYPSCRRNCLWKWLRRWLPRGWSAISWSSRSLKRLCISFSKPIRSRNEE